jgi:hypothetical protein
VLRYFGPQRSSSVLLGLRRAMKPWISVAPVGCVGGDGEHESVAEAVAEPSRLCADGEAGGEKFNVSRAGDAQVRG